MSLIAHDAVVAQHLGNGRAIWQQGQFLGRPSLDRNRPVATACLSVG
ncbi:hypothetical protein [Paracoccus haematequi]|nr:hypothetical protein [Paracoccus haematequi]